MAHTSRTQGVVVNVTDETVKRLRALADEIERGDRRVRSVIIEEAPGRPVQTHTFVTKLASDE